MFYFWSNWTWSHESGVLGTDIDIFTNFLLRMFWNWKFAIDRTCRREEILKELTLTKIHILEKFKIRRIKRIWAEHYTEPILCKFLGRSFLTNRSSLLEPKCWGEQHIRDAVNVKDFSPRTLGKIRMGRSGRKHLFNACFSRINDTRGSNNIKRVGHLFMGICTRFNITFT